MTHGTVAELSQRRAGSLHGGSATNRDLEILADEPEEDPVHPGAVTPVRSTAHAFPPEACSLEMAEGGLVEAVDLELNSVVVEVEDEMTNEKPGRGGRKASAAVDWVENDRVEAGDAAPALATSNASAPAGSPPTSITNRP